MAVKAKILCNLICLFILSRVYLSQKRFIYRSLFFIVINKKDKYFNHSCGHDGGHDSLIFTNTIKL